METWAGSPDSTYAPRRSYQTVVRDILWKMLSNSLIALGHFQLCWYIRKMDLCHKTKEYFHFHALMILWLLCLGQCGLVLWILWVITGKWRLKITRLISVNLPDYLNLKSYHLDYAHDTFQQLMDMVLAELQWTNCLAYLDDMIIVGRTLKEHLTNLREVFWSLRGALEALTQERSFVFRARISGTHCFPRRLAQIQVRLTNLLIGLHLSPNEKDSSSMDWKTTAKPIHKLMANLTRI